MFVCFFLIFFQKEEKIRTLKQRLSERDAAKNENHTTGDGNLLTVNNKDNLIVADFITGEGTSDSAFGAGVSQYTRSSRASASDFEFSESYL